MFPRAVGKRGYRPSGPARECVTAISFHIVISGSRYYLAPPRLIVHLTTQAVVSIPFCTCISPLCARYPNFD